MSDEAAQWALSALFAAIGAWYLAAAVRVLTERGASRRDVVSASLHAAMCAAMLGVLWPWGTAVPVIAQVTVFTAATAWFAGHALFGTGPGSRHRDWYRAAMMAAMVGMPVVMPLLAMNRAASGAIAAGTTVAASGMGDMLGMSGMGGAMVAAAPPGSAAAWADAASVALAVALLAAAACYLVAALRPVAIAGQRVRAAALLHDGAGVLMAAGMAVVLLEMA